MTIETSQGVSAAPDETRRGRRAWRIIDAILVAMFAFSIIVQFNDPDPVRWILLYAAAAIATLLVMTGRSARLLPAAVALVSFVWAATLAPGVIGRVPFLDMFGAFEMKNIGIEQSREMYGLLFVAAWMLVLIVRTRGPEVSRPPRNSAL